MPPSLFELLAENTLIVDALSTLGRLLSGSPPVASPPKKTASPGAASRSPGAAQSPGGSGLPSPPRRDWLADLPLQASTPPPPLPPRAPGWNFGQLIGVDGRKGLRTGGGLPLPHMLGGALLRNMDGALSGMGAGARRT